jgi:hypothetical protein
LDLLYPIYSAKDFQHWNQLLLTFFISGVLIHLLCEVTRDIASQEMLVNKLDAKIENYSIKILLE